MVYVAPGLCRLVFEREVQATQRALNRVRDKNDARRTRTTQQGMARIHRDIHQDIHNIIKKNSDKATITNADAQHIIATDLRGALFYKIIAQESGEKEKLGERFKKWVNGADNRIFVKNFAQSFMEKARRQEQVQRACSDIQPEERFAAPRSKSLFPGFLWGFSAFFSEILFLHYCGNARQDEARRL